MLRRSMVLFLVSLLLMQCGCAAKRFDLIYTPTGYQAKSRRPLTLYVKKTVDSRPEEEIKDRGGHTFYLTDRHYWQEPSADKITKIIVHELRDSNLFRQVTDTPQDTDLTLETELKSFYAKRRLRAGHYFMYTTIFAPILWPLAFNQFKMIPPKVEAHTKILVTLKRGDKILLEKEYEDIKRAKVKANPVPLLGEMNKMAGESLHRSLERMIKDIEDRVI